MSSPIPVFSVIIPLHVISQRFFSDLLRFDQQEFKKFEILVVSDRFVKLPRVGKITMKLILTGQKGTGPAAKRDVALRRARGRICAFIDDDAYPDPAWLKNSLKFFTDQRVVAVGGPGVTPPADRYWEQLAGLVYESIFCSGKAQHRFLPGQPRFTTDWPAYNLLVRKSTLVQVGGYGNDFYGGEDTFLCLKLMQKGRIFYSPTVLVYHHRRPLFRPLLRQIYNVGIHRGYFAKKFPTTSRQLFYFLPSFLTAGFVGLLVISAFFPIVGGIFVGLCLFFWGIASASVILKTDPVSATIVGLGVIATHLTYGTGFVRGLLTSKLVR